MPVEKYTTEISLITFDEYAIVTIPGELSCLYEEKLAQDATQGGFQHLMIFGLTNDAHGYIITPEAWNHATKESQLSFGGPQYGQRVYTMIRNLFTN